MEKERYPHCLTNLPDYVERCLQALVSEGLAETISLGGALGLLHYLDYRQTHDVDAWWSTLVTAAERQRVMAVITSALAPVGPVKTRRWGDVVSIELQREGRTVFSFQIAWRSAQLEPSAPAP